MSCRLCGESQALHNISDASVHVRVETTRIDRDDFNRWPDLTTEDTFSVPPRGSKFVGCSAGRKTDPGSCSLVYYRTITRIQRADVQDYSVRKAQGAPRNTITLIRKTQGGSTCWEHCRARNQYCANVSGIAAAYNSGALLVWQQLYGRASIPKNVLQGWFRVASDPCERGNIDVTGDAIRNAGKECEMKVDGAVAGFSTVSVTITVPEEVRGALSSSMGPGFSLAFPDARYALALEFSDMDLNRDWGGNIKRVDASQSSAVLETDNGCVLWQFGTN